MNTSINMNQTWDLQFTTQFEKDIKKLKKSGKSSWIKRLNTLKTGIQFNSNITQMKGTSKGFRWRSGNIRVLFRILGETREILLLRAGERKNVYKKNIAKHYQSIKQPLNEQSKINQTTTETISQKPLIEFSDVPINSIPNTEDYFIEEVFIDADELYLLNIDNRYHKELLKSQSLDLLRKNGVPENICSLIEDYLTSPSATHIGKIYNLDNSNNIECIAQQPLSSFLVKLDPQQKKIVNKPLNNGALLIRGGPGTGKTLIHLERIKRILEEGKDTRLSSQKKIGFITFNKTLSQAAQSMFNEIFSEKSQHLIEFKTLDSIVYNLGRQIPSTSAKIISTREQAELLELVIKDNNYLAEVVSRWGTTYILEEFEQVILGNDLWEINDYLSFERRGRKTRLLEKERRKIFTLFKEWVSCLKYNNKTTFSLRRIKILRELHKETIRFTPYDYIFVDELQDLSVISLRIISKIVTHPNNITFAADTAQTIYLKSPSWSNISPDLKFNRGNSFVLQSSYRMTEEIAKAINPLRTTAGEDEIDSSINHVIFNGEPPNWVICNEAVQLEQITSIIQQMIEKSKINPSQMAIIVPDNNAAQSALIYLIKKGIEAKRITRDSKIQLNTNSIHILTTHTAKGLEFPFVFVSSVSSNKYPQSFAMKNCLGEKQKNEELDRYKRLFYVALSRAARGLWMFVDKDHPSEFINMLNPNDWKKELI